MQHCPHNVMQKMDYLGPEALELWALPYEMIKGARLLGALGQMSCLPGQYLATCAVDMYAR